MKKIFFILFVDFAIACKSTNGIKQKDTVKDRYDLKHKQSKGWKEYYKIDKPKRNKNFQQSKYDVD